MKRLRNHSRRFIENIVLIILLFAVQAQGKSPPPAPDDGKTYAVIIGISEYKDVEGLEYAHLDALAFAEFLKSKTGGQVGLENINLFLNGEATAVNIGAALEQVHKKIKKGDRLFIFFAGHGDIEASNLNNGLLLLYNAPASSYFSFGDDYLEVNKLKQMSQDLTGRGIEVVIISDACRSGHLSGGMQGAYSTSVALSEIWSNEIKILSCQPDELSQEGRQWGDGHGVFTYYLIEGLYGLADKNGNSCVNVLEVENYLEEFVVRDAEPASQTPFAVGNKRKTLSCINEEELAMVIKKKEGDIPMMEVVNTKGILDQMISGSDSVVASLYESYQNAIDSGNLIVPPGRSAFDYYKKIVDGIENEHVAKTLQRNLAATLQDNAMEMIVPILKLESFDKKSIGEYQLAAKELETAIGLLGEYHFLTDKLRVRKLFIEAYALCEDFDKQYAGKTIRDTMYLYDAMNLLYDAIAIDPNAAYPYFQLGWVYNRKGDFEKALAVYQKYVELIPNNKRAYNNLGHTYNKLEKYDTAIGCFERVIELDSSYAFTYNNIGYNYTMLKKYVASIPYFKIAIEKDSAYIWPYYNLSAVYTKLDDYEKAKEWSYKTLNLDPNHFLTYYNLACIGLLENNKKEALTNFEKAFEFGFDDDEWINNDPDLDNIRNTRKFKSLMKKYFKR